MEEINQEEKKKVNTFLVILKVMRPYIIIFILTLLFNRFIAQFATVSGESMANTLHNGNIIFFEKLTKNYDRFDVIIFNSSVAEGDSLFLIKRVIALPGEKVKIDYSGDIYVNGVLLEEKFGLEKMLNPGIASSEITLGKDEYFVLGDNRNHSLDSRNSKIAAVHLDSIRGKVLFCLKPPKSVYKTQY